MGEDIEQETRRALQHTANLEKCAEKYMHPRPQFSSGDAVMQGLNNFEIAAAKELHEAADAAWIKARHTLKTSAEFRSTLSKTGFDLECRSVLARR